jgi:hypothetical protein
MLHQHRRLLQGFDDKVVVGDRSHGVHDDAVETEFGCHGGTVDAEWIADQCAGAERGAVDACYDFTEAGEVIAEHGAVTEEPVGPADGLGTLQVCSRASGRQSPTGRARRARGG